MNINGRTVLSYRPEIDGLRAVSVLSVIFFHAGFDLFSGGYVGVDVFFVISGYLITSILTSEAEGGAISILNFYERRARRILPALFFVVLACLPFAWLWLMPSELVDFGRSLISVATFSSNFYFYRSTNYFSPSADELPFLHTWSLAVEEQFYLFFPLLMLAFYKFGRKSILVGLFLLMVASFLGAEWESSHRPIAAFFLLHTRAWELFVGALVALTPSGVLMRWRESNYSGLFALVGFLLVIFSVIWFGRDTPNPSMYTSAPILGAALVVIFGTPSNLVGRILSLPLIVRIGLISYSAYLWHQPIFAFLRIHEAGQPHWSSFLAAALLTLSLAWISWRFVEKPFRLAKASRNYVLKVAVVGLLCVGLIGGLLIKFSAAEDRLSLLDVAVLKTFERGDANCFDQVGVKNSLNICGVADDRIVNAADYLILGDSHMYSALPAFRLLESKGRISWGSGAYVGFSGCPPFVGVFSLRKDQEDRNCNWLNEKMLAKAVEMGVRKVVLIARWTYYTDGGYDGKNFSFIGLSSTSVGSKDQSREAFRVGFSKTVESWRKKGISVFVVSQVPQQKVAPRDVYYKAGLLSDEAVLTDLSVDYLEHRQLQAWVSSVFGDVLKKYSGVDYFDVGEYFCETKCLVGTPSQSWYFDKDHLSVKGAERLGDLLVDAVSEKKN